MNNVFKPCIGLKIYNKYYLKKYTRKIELFILFIYKLFSVNEID